MNIKKMFTTLSAMVVAVSMTLPTASVFGATYSAELEGAYNWAHEKGVTTMSSIDNANMYGAITRAEMAKMLSVYATTVLEPAKTVDTSKACTFTDIDSVKGDLHDYIIESCQLGIMGQGITEFRPYDTISRAEFGTALSRVLWGSTYEGGTPYYAKHLEALKAQGIMNQIANAQSTKEVRGYVMLMLQRSDEGGATVDEGTKLLACVEKCGSDADCLSKCYAEEKDNEKEDTVVKAGNLVVSVNEDSSETISVPKEGIINLASVDLDSSESITLDNITVSRIGLSSKSDVKSIWFEKNGVRVSGKSSLASDGTASVTFNNGLTVKSSDTIDLVAELNAAAGSEIQFEITKVESSAKDYSIKGGKTPTYRTVNYSVANVNFVKKGTDAEYKLGDQDSYEIAKFNIENNNNAADDKDVKVESIILKNVGTADLENLDNIVVYRDSKKVSEKVTVNGKNLEIVLNDTIESGKKGIYTVEANITYVDRDNDTYQLSLNKTADVVAYEESTNMRVTLTVAAPLNLATYTVKGGKMVFATASDSPKTVDAGVSYTDVVLAEGTLTVAEPIKLETLTLNGSITAGTHAGQPLNTVLKKVRVEIGNSSYTALDATGGKIIFDNEMYISKTSKVKVIADIATTASDGDQLSIDPIKGSAFAGGEYQNSSNSFTPSATVAGSVTMAKLTVKAAKFNMTKTSKSSEIKVVETVNDEVSVFNGKITNNQNSALTVNDLMLKFNSTVAWNANQEIYFTLKIGGKTISKTYKNTTTSGNIVFSSLGINLDKDESVEFEVLASATTVSTPSSITNITINATAKGTDANGNESATNDVFVATYKVVAAGTATVTKSSVSNSAFMQNTSDNAFAQWTVTVKDEDLTLKGIELTYGASSVIDNNILNTWKVTYDSKELNGSISTDTANTKLVMDDLNETLKPGTYTFKAYADFGTLTGDSETLALTKIDMKLQGVNAITTGATVTYSHAVFKTVPVISFVKTRTADNDVKNFFAVKISNPQSSEETMTVKTFTFGGNQTSNVTVTHGDDRAGYNNTTDTLTLAPGESETFYFEATNTLSGGSFELSLTNVNYDSVTTLNAYSNVVKWADLKVNGRITN